MQFIIKVTSACNLSCTYCSEGIRTLEYLSLHTYKHFIQQIPSLLQKLGQQRADIIWHGGEPLIVSKDWIKEAIDFTNSVLEGFDVSYAMQTNGTLIDDEWIKIFKMYSISLGISLDGYLELHDQYRVNKDGSGSFETIVQNLYRLRNENIPVSLLMVVNSEELIDYEKVWNTICELGISIKIQPVVPIGKADYQLAKSVVIYNNYANLLKYLYTQSLEHDSNIVIQPIAQIMSSILSGEEIKECAYSGSCTYNIITLYPNGDVGFCGRMSNEDETFIYGNIHKFDLVSLYNSDVVDKIRGRQVILRDGVCKNCDIWEYCHGGCTIDAIASNGDINTKYHYCESYKNLIDYFMTDGLRALKDALISRKRRYRMLMEEKKKLLKGLNDER